MRFQSQLVVTSLHLSQVRQTEGCVGHMTTYPRWTGSGGAASPSGGRDLTLRGQHGSGRLVEVEQLLKEQDGL